MKYFLFLILSFIFKHSFAQISFCELGFRNISITNQNDNDKSNLIAYSNNLEIEPFVSIYKGNKGIRLGMSFYKVNIFDSSLTALSSVNKTKFLKSSIYIEPIYTIPIFNFHRFSFFSTESLLMQYNFGHTETTNATDYYPNNKVFHYANIYEYQPFINFSLNSGIKASFELNKRLQLNAFYLLVLNTNIIHKEYKYYTSSDLDPKTLLTESTYKSNIQTSLNKQLFFSLNYKFLNKK